MGQLMFQKFPQIARYTPTDMEELMLFRITPEIISVLDYRKGFGHTELVRVAACSGERCCQCPNRRRKTVLQVLI